MSLATSIRPCFSRVLIQEPIRSPDLKIVLPETIENPETLTFFSVLACGPEVTCCKPGDKVLLRPDANRFALTTTKPIIGLIDASAILAIDDSEPIELAP